ncbi:hypothetical protein PVAND_013516 [Polypedilum vanderplanki]|uniref:Odorant receptor n=1 Tax=Polypedilum vanderplanki TaxID=319348 RepID=A0A9J6CQQ6_POLVA|nr:hypothetical protein PVAND_013516 [Polypedilum vanderplanki]
MLLYREPFKSLFKFFTFIGLWDEISIRQRRWTQKVPLTLAIAFTLFNALSVIQAKKLEQILNVVEIVPLHIMILFSALEFHSKKVKLKKLIKIVDQIEVENSDATPIIDETCHFFSVWLNFMNFFYLIAFIIFAISPLLFHKLVFDVYTPQVLKNQEFYYYLSLFIQIFGGIYHTMLVVSIYEIKCGLLLILNDVMQYFHQKLIELKVVKENSEVTKKNLVECINMHLHIKE